MKANPDLEFELVHGFPEQLVVGVDEVGRGCLAGPVVAAAVILPSSLLESFRVQNADRSHLGMWSHVQDSKLIPEKERHSVAAFLRENVAFYGIAEASPQEIDSLNIHHASLLAMRRAVEKIKFTLEKGGKSLGKVLVDGKFSIPGIDCLPLVKGDQRSLSIAAASILAKVNRDQFMSELHLEYPLYHFREHKGYPTPIHKKVLRSFGPCDWHRKSFGPVAAVLPSVPIDDASKKETRTFIQS